MTCENTFGIISQKKAIDTMAVGDGENPNDENQAMDITGSVNVKEQRESLKTLLRTPLSKGETW